MSLEPDGIGNLVVGKQQCFADPALDELIDHLPDNVRRPVAGLFHACGIVELSDLASTSEDDLLRTFDAFRSDFSGSMDVRVSDILERTRILLTQTIKEGVGVQDSQVASIDFVAANYTEGDNSATDGDELHESVGLLCGTPSPQQVETRVLTQAFGRKVIRGGFLFLGAAFLLGCMSGTTFLLSGASGPHSAVSALLSNATGSTLNEMPSRSAASGESQGLIPFMHAEEKPPRPQWVWTSKELEPRRAPPPKRQANIIWVHLHNYAGSSMCRIAHWNGETVYKKNCNWPGDGVVGLGWGLKYAHRARCAERAEHAQITFSEIERELQRGDLGCQTAISGIMLRDPFKGARSTVLYEGFGKQLNGILKNIAAKTKPHPFGGHMAGHDYQFFDNFAVRTLSGNYWLPPGKVSRMHLEAAKAVLSRIDVIIILEELVTHFPQFEKHFKWDMTRERASEKTTSTKRVRTRNGHTSAEYDKAMSAEDEALIKSFNALDYELYEFGKTLAAERTRSASSR